MPVFSCVLLWQTVKYIMTFSFLIDPSLFKSSLSIEKDLWAKAEDAWQFWSNQYWLGPISVLDNATIVIKSVFLEVLRLQYQKDKMF